MSSLSKLDEETLKKEENGVKQSLYDLIQGKNTTQSLDFILPLSHQYKKVIGKDAIDALIFYVSSFNQDIENLQKVLSILTSLIDDDSSDSISNASHICSKEESIVSIAECLMLPDLSTKNQALRIIIYLVHLQENIMQTIFIQNEQVQRQILQLVDDDKIEIQKLFYQLSTCLSHNNLDIEKMFSNSCIEMLIKCLTSEFPVIPNFLINILQNNPSFQLAFVENGHISKLINLIKKRDRNAIDIVTILFTSKDAESFGPYLNNTELFSLINELSSSNDNANDRYLFIHLLGDIIRGNKELSCLIFPKLQTYFDIACKFNQANDREFFACSHLFECFAQEMPQELTDFITKICFSADFNTEFDQNPQKIAIILKIGSICVLSNEKAITDIFHPEDSDCLFIKGLSLFSRITLKMDNLLISLLMFLAVCIWESKQISKFALSKLSNMPRHNKQSALHFLSSLSQVTAECPIKGIGSFILLELLQYLSNSKSTSVTNLKNNVFSYTRQLLALKDQSLFSIFIQKSFAKIQNAPVNTPPQKEAAKENPVSDFSKLQEQLTQLYEEYSTSRTRFLREIDQVKRDTQSILSADMESFRSLIEKTIKKIDILSNINEELINNKTQSDEIQLRQIQLLKKENQELKNKIISEQENMNLKKQMESNQVKNEELTHKLESIKKMKNEFSSVSEVEALKTEIRKLAAMMKEQDDEINRLNEENNKLVKKESEFLSYRDKLLDAKIQLINLRKENKQLKEKLQLNEKINNGVPATAPVTPVKSLNKNHEESEHSNNELSSSMISETEHNKSLAEEIESLKQQLAEKDMLNAELKANQLKMTNQSQTQVKEIKMQLLESAKLINSLKTSKIELTTQLEELKDKLKAAELSNTNNEANQVANTTSTSISEQINEMRINYENKINEQDSIISELLKKIEINSNISSKVIEYENKIREYEIENNEYKNKISEQEGINRKYEEQIGQYENSKLQYETKIAEFENSKTQYEAKINEYENNDAKYKLRINEYEKILNEQKTKIDKYISTINENETNLCELKIKLSDKEGEVNLLKTQQESNSELYDLKLQLENSKEYCKQKDAEIVQKDALIQQMQNTKETQMVKLIKELSKIKKNNTTLSNQVETLNEEVQSKDNKISMLQAQINIFQQFKLTENLKDQEIVNLQSQLEDIQDKNENLQQILSEKNDEINLLHAEIDQLQKNEQTIVQNTILEQTSENISNNDNLSIIENYEAQIAGYKIQITNLENKLLEYDESQNQSFLKETEVEKLKDDLIMKDDEIYSLKNELAYIQKKMDELEKIQDLYYSGLTTYPSQPTTFSSQSTEILSNGLSPSQEISRLNLLVSDLQDKIDELNYQIKNNPSSKECALLKQRCENLEKELEQRRFSQETETENTLKLRRDISTIQQKYQSLKEQLNVTGYEFTSYEKLADKYKKLENKHQAALKLIGKLWSRNQSLIYQNDEKLLQLLDNSSFSPSDSSFKY